MTEQQENETPEKSVEKDTQTVTKPLELIPIEKIPAGEIRKEDDTQKTTQKTDAQTTESPSDEEKNKSTKTKETGAEPVQKQQYYTVQEGDTLSGICQKRYGNIRNVKKIVELNKMENSDDIRVGQKLLLP